MNAEILRLGCYARINVSTRMASFPCVILVPLRLPRKCEFKECIHPINLAINKKKEEEEKRGTLSTSFSFTRHVRHSRVNKSRGKIKEGKREREKGSTIIRTDYYSTHRREKTSLLTTLTPPFSLFLLFPYVFPSLFPSTRKANATFARSSTISQTSDLRPPSLIPIFLRTYSKATILRSE